MQSTSAQSELFTMSRRGVARKSDPVPFGGKPNASMLSRIRHALKLAGLAARTANIYLCSTSDFVTFNKLSRSLAAQEEARAWFEHLTIGNLSAPRLRQHFAALKFLFVRTLGRPEVTAFLERSPVFKPTQALPETSGGATNATPTQLQ
jgi:hypothetical protein